MDSLIYNPLEEFDGKFKALHLQKTEEFFEDLVKRSGINPEENKDAVRRYEHYKEGIKGLKKKFNWLRFLRVLMCISLVLIPLVITSTTPKIKSLRKDIAEADERINKLYEKACEQMRPLNELFTEWDSVHLVAETIPLLSFERYFSVEQEADMKTNYDFTTDPDDRDQSTVDVLAGHYNDNPLLFEKRIIHTMGEETYHGQKTIYWTEQRRGADGKMQTVSRSETLHASVTKPKPFYKTKLVLNYCAQAGPELSFSRDATHLDKKSDKSIERYVKSGEKRLKKKTDKAIKSDGDFVSMSNSRFEVLFDALDRTNEVQFRTLFTPLAQTNIEDLILADNGYGDDFNFVKKNRTNEIFTDHSQTRAVRIDPSEYTSHKFEQVKANFIEKNVAFFKAVYFDLAPILAIPVYQDRPVHSLKPIPSHEQQYSFKEFESLANSLASAHVAHPNTKTSTILKSQFLTKNVDTDMVQITAYSYDIENRTDYIPVWGGDGKLHNVPVHWDLYIPLTKTNTFGITDSGKAAERATLGTKNNLCIFKI